MIDELSYRYYHFGPLLIKTKINPNDLKVIKKLINKKSNKVNNILAGVIENEHQVNLKNYSEIIGKYLNLYLHAHEQRTGEKKKARFEITNAWVNYMKAGEYNPPHTHDSCNISTVLFLEIPDSLKKENDKWKKLNIKSGGPGSLEFMYMLQEDFCIGNINVFPEEGDFFMFPNYLFHFVAPFKSKVERISLASNIKIHY